jgi:hypothetical protein
LKNEGKKKVVLEFEIKRGRRIREGGVGER